MRRFFGNTTLLPAVVFASCHAVELLHDGEFLIHADRSTPVQGLITSIGAGYTIAILLIVVIALAVSLLRSHVRRNVRNDKNEIMQRHMDDHVIEEREEIHHIRIRRRRE